jgi:enediyne biosynthesis protein E4
MRWTRREVLALAAGPVLGQGMGTRSAPFIPRGKPSGIPFGARLSDVAAQAGLTAPVIYGGVQHKTYILETVGCGCAFFDYDNDGWLDIFLLSGTRLDENPEEATNRLYHNNRDGTFTDITNKAGLHRQGWASSVTVGDFNNDGNEDLFITYWGQNVLYRNNGDGTFTDVTAAAGLKDSATRWGAGATWVDYDRDGHLDLFVSNYLEFDFATVPKPGETPYCKWRGVSVNCGPRGLPPGRHSLYHNNGDGTFSDVTAKSGIDKSRRTYGMTAIAADFDNDGWPDIYVACDSTPSLYFRNRHDGTFAEEGLLRGVAVNEDGVEQAGMGVGVGDYNLDGSLDILKTHLSDDTNIVYRNDGKGNFTDETNRAGLRAESRFTCWGAGIVDLDNDGLPDLFITTGSVYPEVEGALAAYPAKTPRCVFRNLGDSKFEELIAEAGPGVEAAHCSRGCAFGDFDNDGDVDVLIVNLNEPPSLLRNDVAGTRHWIKVLLTGTKSNRSAIGSRVTVVYGARRQAQEVLAQSSFYSVNDRRLHFGLGDEKEASIEIKWTSGGTERFPALAANRLYAIREGEGIVRTESMLRAGH